MPRSILVVLLACGALSAPASAAVSGNATNPDARLTPEEIQAVARDSVSPRATCRKKDQPDTGLQGQVPIADRQTGRADKGYWCNLDVVALSPEGRTFASFDAYEDCLYVADHTWVDAGKHLAAAVAGSPQVSAGSAVLVYDMADSARPKITDRLTSPLALSPDETLAVNHRRGLLVMGATLDPHIDVYDIKTDCRKPKLIGTYDVSPATGHAGWFSADGNTYWLTDAFKGLGGQNSPSIFPIDLTDPSKPKTMASFAALTAAGHNGYSSDDSSVSYACQTGQAKAEDNRILVFRNPKPGENPTRDQALVSDFHLEGSVCQDAKAVSYGGRPYLIANSEYTIGRAQQKGPTRCGEHPENLTNFGVPEIFDVSDLQNVKVVSHLMLEIDDPANCEVTANDGTPDPETQFPGEIYDTHFCRPDRLHDPTILACARFLSGLEVYDIRDPRHPREIAYWRGGTLGNQAMMHPDWRATDQTLEDCFAPPVVRADRGEIWFGCYYTGMRVFKLPAKVYPYKSSLTCENDYYFNQYNPGHCPGGDPTPSDCYRGLKSASVKLDGASAGARIRGLKVTVNGKRQRTARLRKGAVKAVLARGRDGYARVRVLGRTNSGKRIIERRSYKLCA